MGIEADKIKDISREALIKETSEKFRSSGMPPGIALSATSEYIAAISKKTDKPASVNSSGR